MTFEITIESVEEARVAEHHGAKRVELCSALSLGGLTPSLGLIQQVLDALNKTELHVLIRPRSGNFIYSKEEVLTMLSDIDTCAQLGVKGVVFGVLKTDLTLDEEITQQLCTYAQSKYLEVTFHRAIDLCSNLTEALDALVEMKFERILTSGQENTAIEGIQTITKMVEQVNGNIQIMAGSGVSAHNAHKLICTGLDALHFSIRKSEATLPLSMGNDYVIDTEKIDALMTILNKN